MGQQAHRPRPRPRRRQHPTTGRWRTWPTRASLVPESVMPAYAFLAEKPLRVADPAQHLLANRAVGVPYTDDMVANAEADLRAQADPEADREGLLARYPNAAVGELDGRPNELTEMDAPRGLPAGAGADGRLRPGAARRSQAVGGAVPVAEVVP